MDVEKIVAEELLQAYDRGGRDVKSEFSSGSEKVSIVIRDVDRTPHYIELKFELSVLSDGKGPIVSKGIGGWDVGRGPELIFDTSFWEVVGEELAVKIKKTLRETLRAFADKYGYSLASGMSISTDEGLEQWKSLSEGAKALWQSFKEGTSCHLLFWEGTTIALEGLQGEAILLKVETMDFGGALIEARIVDGQAKLLVKEGYEEIFMELPELKEVVEDISLGVWREMEAEIDRKFRVDLFAVFPHEVREDGVAVLYDVPGELASRVGNDVFKSYDVRNKTLEVFCNPFNPSCIVSLRGLSADTLAELFGRFTEYIKNLKALMNEVAGTFRGIADILGERGFGDKLDDFNFSIDKVIGEFEGVRDMLPTLQSEQGEDKKREACRYQRRKSR